MDEYQTEGRHECLVSLSSSHLIYETNTAPSDDPSRCDIYFSPDESHERVDHLTLSLSLP